MKRTITKTGNDLEYSYEFEYVHSGNIYSHVGLVAFREMRGKYSISCYIEKPYAYHTPITHNDIMKQILCENIPKPIESKYSETDYLKLSDCVKCFPIAVRIFEKNLKIMETEAQEIRETEDRKAESIDFAISQMIDITAQGVES